MATLKSSCVCANAANMHEILQLPFDLDYVEFKIEKKMRSKAR